MNVLSEMTVVRNGFMRCNILYDQQYHYCILKSYIVSILMCIDLIWFGLVWFGLVWFGLVWFGLVWFGLVWFNLI